VHDLRDAKLYTAFTQFSSWRFSYDFSSPTGSLHVTAALLILPFAARAEDDKTPQKPATPEKAVEPAAPADSATQGAIDAGGQHITYTAIAGTITVVRPMRRMRSWGRMEGPFRAANWHSPRPKSQRIRLPWRTCFTWRTSRRTRSRKNGPSRSSITADRAARRFGCTWGRSGQACGDCGRYAPAGRALHDGRQSQLAARRKRSGLYRYAGHRIRTPRGQRRREGLLGIDQDANAFTRFIARFVTKYGRWNSPKFIFGESYGTTRSAVVANLLQDKQDIDLNGVILLSQIFNFTADIDRPGVNPGVDLPYELALPTTPRRPGITRSCHNSRPR